MRSIFLPPSPSKNEYKKFENPWISDEIDEETPGYKALTLEDLGYETQFGVKAQKAYDLSKKLQYRVIRNDGTQQSLVWLLEMRNIIMVQLSNLQASYITRFIFDRNHQTLLIISDGSVVGGMVFRLFPKLAELVFCTLGRKFHTNGYGSYMMSVFKTYLQTIGIHNIFTYADNTAIVFFNRHGFTKNSSLKYEEWKSYLKDYENATLLSCTINPNVDYLMIHAAIDAQLLEVQKKLGSRKIQKIEKFPVTKLEGVIVKKKQQQIVIDQNMHAALSAIMQKPQADMFWILPKSSVFSELSLTNINDKIKSGSYESYQQFHNDVLRVFNGVIEESPDGNAFTIAANAIKGDVIKILNSYGPINQK